MRKAVILRAEISPGAPPDEHDTLIQAGSVSAALANLGYDPIPVEFGLNMHEVRTRIAEICPEFIFNLVEAVDGQDRLIHLAPALLDVTGLPYTGSSTEAIFLTSHKVLAKRLMRAQGLPTPSYVTIEEDGETLFHPGAYIIKSIRDHASAGITDDSVVHAENHSELLAHMKRRAPSHGSGCFAEAYIDGREFNLSVLAGPDGPVVLPPAEIVFRNYPPEKPKIVDYRAKWQEDSFEYVNTPRTFDFPPEDRTLLAKLDTMALDCFRFFHMRGYARVDFRVDPDGTPWILEVNANPCLTPDGGFTAAALAAGLSYDAMIGRIIGDLY
ncbi:MAG TPA: D-alanine--D-alanine ligase [Spirochaetota bacterium]|nr:D-alanine--D-alanine ligase [Spirochaetota bacterium]